METINFRLTGMAPLLMHSDKLSDPIDPGAIAHKKLTAKRTKTEEDHEAIAKSEFMAGMYWDREMGPYIPSRNLHKCLEVGARAYKLGKKVRSGVVFLQHAGYPLLYDGPRDPEELWKKKFVDRRSVKVSQSRLWRCRPRFNEWAVEAELIVDSSQLNAEEVIQSFESAGRIAGLGDYVPTFGRFDFQVL